MLVVSLLISVSHDISSQDRSSRRISLRVSSRVQALANVLSWFDQLSSAFVNQEDWEQCRIALAEGFTNAVKHAHGHLSPETPIDLTAICEGAAVEIQIWDQGKPFNLQHYLERLSPQGPRDAESGRGIRLIREIADHFHYERTPDGRNCLHIAKRLSPRKTRETLVSPPS